MRSQTEVAVPIRFIREFIKLESAGGIILFTLAVLALILDNSPLSTYYQAFFNAEIGFHIADFTLTKPLIMWINEGLMAIFFFLVGLEVKRELFEGELNSLAKISLPGFAALGGMVVPAIIYISLNWGDHVAMRGWAIPTATDIAFSLAILALLGKRVPVSLKIFLTALAIFDDIGAIIIIAIFYTVDITEQSLLFAGICLVVLFALNRLRVRSLIPYIMVGILLWFFVLESGVHATLAGVALAFAIPLRDPQNPERSPLRELEQSLHPWVVFAVLPLFSFANAGVSFSGLHLHDLVSGVPLGIILGLFIGKQIGIFLATWLAVRCKIVRMPSDGTWTSIYGIALICGVGFTMSLFIGGLAFDSMSNQSYAVLVRFGVLVGSMLSGILGYLLLRFGTCTK